LDVGEIILTVLQILLSIGLITVILLQSGKSAGLSGSIAGGAETFFGKKKGLDDFLAKITVFVAIGFAAISLILVVLAR